MSELNLPPVDVLRFTKPKSTGRWEANGLNLATLAASLHVPPEAALTQELKSVPDPWAQLQIFNDALLGDHVLHDSVVAQWRALLSILALRAQYASHYEVELSAVRLLDEKPPTGPFHNALVQLLPRESIDGKANWHDLYLLAVRERVGGGRSAQVGAPQILGVLNPVTLLAAGKPARSANIRGVPWLSNGLVDPTGDDTSSSTNRQGLRRRDYAVIGRYLDDIIVAVKAAGRRPTVTRLLAELGLFREACQRHETLGTARAEAATKAARLAVSPLFEPLVQPFVSEPQEVLSDCFLRLRADISETDQPFTGIILVDDGVGQTLKRSAHDVHVWKQHTLSEVGNPAVLKTIKEEAEHEGYLVLTADEFFTAELVKLEPKAEVSGHTFESGFRGAVLPLSPVVLLASTPSELASDCRLSVAGGAAHEVSLTLKLASGARHTIRKIFKGEVESRSDIDGVVTDQTIPMGLAVWPDFYHREWPWNFLRFQHDPSTSELQTRAGTSGHLVGAELRSVTAGRARALAAVAYREPISDEEARPTEAERVTPNDRDVAVSRIRYSSTTSKVQELQLSRLGFEAISLFRRPSENEGPRLSGMVLLERRRLPSSVGGGIVAIDFGTTSTIAAVKEPNSDKPKKVTLKDRVIFPISIPDQDVSNRDLVKWTFLDFFPPSDNETPLPTVAKLPAIETDGLPALQSVQRQEDDRMLFSSVIFFLPSSARSAGSVSDAENLIRIKDSLQFNLKWGSDDLIRKASRRYLRQLAMMIGAELWAEGIDPKQSRWRLSYPQALPDVETFLEEFERSLATLWGKPEGQQGWSVEAFTEAGAAAAYFHGAGAAPGDFVVILDIGGGTTDVAIWDKTELVWRGSLRVAGGDFFTTYLFNNPALLRDGLKLPDLATTVEQKPNKQILELFFHDRRFSPAFDQHYNDIARSYGAGLRVASLTALAGIAYYVGLVTKGLIDQGIMSAEGLEGMSFALGGRGSEVFRRFHRASASERTPLERALSVFGSAVGLPAEFLPHVSMTTAAKSEVIMGMMGSEDNLTLARSRVKSAYLPLGEDVRVRLDGDVKVVGKYVSVEEIVNATLDGHLHLEELNRFLDVLDTVGGIGIDLAGAQGGKAHIEDQVSREYRAALKRAQQIVRQQSDEGSRRAVERKGYIIEPLFITSLRALVELLTCDPEQRAKRIAAHEHA